MKSPISGIISPMGKKGGGWDGPASKQPRCNLTGGRRVLACKENVGKEKEGKGEKGLLTLSFS